jgi:type II secretory pathway pseudopilin PulG
MLSALNPAAANSSNSAAQLSAATARIAQLQAQVERLRQENRRKERLLLLTRKSWRLSVKTPHRGRWPKTLPEAAPGARPRGTHPLPLLIVRARKSDAPSSTPSGVPSP